MSFQLIPNLILIISVAGILVVFLRHFPEVVEEKANAKINSQSLDEIPQSASANVLEGIVNAVQSIAVKVLKTVWHFMLEAKDLKQGQILASKFVRMVTPVPKSFNIGVHSSMRKAERLISERKFDEAEDVYISVIERHPHEYSAYEGLVKIYTHQRNLDNLMEVLRYLIKHVPSNDSYLAQMGNVLMSTRHYDQALQMYEKSLELNNLIPARFVNAGLCSEALADNTKAVGYLQKAVDLEPSNMDYLILLVDIFEKLGENDRALKTLKEAAEMHPDNALIAEKLLQFEN